MNAPDDYCELCDLPLSQCVHGQPPPPPPAPRGSASGPPRTRSRSTTPGAASRSASKPASKPASTPAPAPTRSVVRRWTPPEAFKPLILEVLDRAGGELDNDDLFRELESLVEDRLLVGDREKTPEGEPRWRYAARRARVALIDEGVMIKGRPGVWQLA